VDAESTRYNTKTIYARNGTHQSECRFDTNIVIDALNGVSDPDAEYNRYARVLIRRITWMEVLVSPPDDDTQTRDFLQPDLRSFHWI
jgi:hypothetical protein